MMNKKLNNKLIYKALKRFQELVYSLECECDPYCGFTCPIHRDRGLADHAITKFVEEYNNEN